MTDPGFAVNVLNWVSLWYVSVMTVVIQRVFVTPVKFHHARHFTARMSQSALTLWQWRGCIVYIRYRGVLKSGPQVW